MPGPRRGGWGGNPVALVGAVSVAVAAAVTLIASSSLAFAKNKEHNAGSGYDFF